MRRDYRSAYERCFPEICQTIRRMRFGADPVQNALCWSWQLWPTIVEYCLAHYAGDDPIGHAAQLCGVRAAQKRERFGCPKPKGGEGGGYRDAMTRIDDEPTPDIEQTRGEDCQPIRWRINQMPPKLQTVATLLANGLTRDAIATKLGVHRHTVYSRVSDIVDWITARS